jgi:hypothetical protein
LMAPLMAPNCIWNIKTKNKQWYRTISNLLDIMHHKINLSPMSKDFKAQVTAKSAACGQTIPEKHRSKDSSRSTHLSTMGLSEKQVPNAIHWISLDITG